MTFSHDLLIESKAVRSQALQNASNENAIAVLNKAKAVILATWQGVGYATTEQVSDYYEVNITTVKEALRTNRDEFDNEVKTIDGNALKDARQVICLPSKTSQALIWTARGFLRIGLMLRDSKVSKMLRDIIVNAASENKIQVVETLNQFERTSLKALGGICNGIADVGAIVQTIESDIKKSASEVKASVAASAIETISEVRHAAHSVSEEIKELKELVLANQVVVQVPAPAVERETPNRDDKYRINIRFKPEQYEAVIAIADASGMPRSHFFRDLIVKVLGVENV